MKKPVLKESVLVEIMESIVETGIYPEKYALILEKLVNTAVICKVHPDNGPITIKLSPAHKCYYKLYKRITPKSFAWRLVCRIYCFIFKHENLARLQESIDKVEKIKNESI